MTSADPGSRHSSGLLDESQDPTEKSVAEIVGKVRNVWVVTLFPSNCLVLRKCLLYLRASALNLLENEKTYFIQNLILGN